MAQYWRLRTMNVPKPESFTLSPLARVAQIPSETPSTSLAASARETDLLTNSLTEIRSCNVLAGHRASPVSFEYTQMRQGRE